MTPSALADFPRPSHPSRLCAVLRVSYAVLGGALACVAFVPTPTLAAFFAHGPRTDLNGGVIVETTVQGAALLRVLAPIAGLALAALALLGDRLFARGAGEAAPLADGSAPSSRSAPPPATRRDAQVLFVAMAAALAVRAPLLSESLWYDEIAAFMGYGAHGPGAAMGNYYTQANHILQSLLSWCSAWLLGPSEVSLRLPALIAGVLVVPAVWWLGREAGSARVARGAAIAAALMPVAVLESTEARGYAFMAYYATLATASLLWARRMRSGGGWAEYAVICALGGWSHLVTLCVPIFHGVWSAWVLLSTRDKADRRNAVAALLALAVAALLTIALYAPALPDMATIAREFKAADGNEPSLLGPQGVMMLLMLAGAWTWWASLAGLPLVMIGVAAARRQPALALALALTLGGGLVALLAPVAFNSWLYARFLTFVVPAVALAAGAGGAVLLAWRPRAGAIIVSAVAVAWVASVHLLPPRQPLREGVAYIAAHQAKGDRSLAIGLPDDVHDWYAPQMGIAMQGTGPYGRNLEQGIRTVHPRWILMLYPRAMPVRVHELLRSAGYRQVESLPGWIDQGDGAVLVYERSVP